ncbi:YlbF family regulator [Listeria booriae]|uniref:UPF0342 protein EP57_00560 n=1 Tax=Listeria booriae TaxID=1552123 RepID=A0A099WN15_9LIST|nr:YlbF family regulator [Listeria booriae]KGL45525.1 hypothetical protein EP57_00560 [Listeria booriae]MBC1551906.1 YlbF family regulator [Listeria booriae]MBC1560278.1 YlbF family regulator [Listeria booriae]MBC1564987.1 YlbF family regulator [Listeria booriae]MBC1778491.1 YlbF family regulator [Listeria booriae]
MTVNIYDIANDLEKGIRDTEQFTNLKQAYADVNADPEAKTKFDRFRNVQVTIQEKQMTGQEIDQETIDLAQEVAEEVQSNKAIVNLMDKEQAMSVIINDLNRIIMTPLQELYDIKED